MNRPQPHPTGDLSDAVPQELAHNDIANGAERPGTPEVAFENLAGNNPEILIHFRGQIYRLRATRNGKLILNK